jgi:hypothetical protein
MGNDAVLLVVVDDDQVGDRAAVDVANEAVGLVEQPLGSAAVARPSIPNRDS